MKPVIISIALFMVMKIAYNYFGVYEDTLWMIAFYVPMYVMVAVLLRYVWLQAHKLERLFLFVSQMYFWALILVNLICIFDTDLYRRLIIDLNKFGLPGIVIMCGLAYLIIMMFTIYKKRRIKSHDKKRN